jgi:hypothetical protein
VAASEDDDIMTYNEREKGGECDRTDDFGEGAVVALDVSGHALRLDE